MKDEAVYEFQFFEGGSLRDLYVEGIYQVLGETAPADMPKVIRDNFSLYVEVIFGIKFIDGKTVDSVFDGLRSAVLLAGAVGTLEYNFKVEGHERVHCCSHAESTTSVKSFDLHTAIIISVVNLMRERIASLGAGPKNNQLIN